ncbi:MAG TPA: adenylate/guanylate cyclase domain-containing protein [Solirubrobacteraceae bacterium]
MQELAAVPAGGLGAAPPAPSRTGPSAAHRRHMTVMFCDIVGSTPLAETLDPEDFREILTGYQEACARATDRYHGYTARYAGDGIVLYFGYPQAREDSAECAVHAGLAMLEELEELNVGLRDQHGISLRVRIGIHTGLVVAGEMGVGETRERMAIVGETPHIAARLESIAAPQTVVISDATRDLVEGYFVAESLGPQQLKGVSRLIGVHRVLRATGAVGRLEVAGERRLTPLVGRDHELARLAQAWQQVKRGHGAIVHLTGEAGIGKSRIVRELLDRLNPQVGEAQIWRCSPHHQGTTLHPVIRHLERLLALDAGRPAAEKMAILSEAVQGAGLAPADAVPILARLLAIRGGLGESTGGLTPRDVRTATLHILEALLISNPARHPLLLVVEDVHWADPTTVELLHRLVADLAHLPVLCLLTLRPEIAPPWMDSSPVLQLDLGPLSSENVRALAAWASVEPLDPAVLDWVDSTADGVPLFVEETLKMLEHADQLTPGNGHDSLTHVPSTLQGLLTERLDRLPALGVVVDVAAVLGREFDRDLLAALWPTDGPALEPAMAQLAVQDVLRPVPGERGRCEFSHALLQEAAYDRILRRRRQALHGRVAGVLTERFATLVEREPEIVARHWDSAAEPDKAVGYWHTAGMRALERAAFLESAEHFRRGLEALDAAGADETGDLERVDLLTYRAASLQAAHGYAAAGVQQAYAAARRVCERTGSDERLVSVNRGEWSFYLLRAEYGQALALGDEMLSLGEQAGDELRLAEGHLYRGLVHMYLANFDVARDHLEQAFTRYHRSDEFVQIYEAQGDMGSAALAYLALILWNLGIADESRVRSDLSLELADDVGGPVTKAQAWGMRSILHLARGEPVELRHWTEKTRAHSADLNIGYWHTVSLLHAAWQQGRGGQLSSSIATLEQQLDEYLASGSRLSLPHFYILLADLRLAAGDQPRALEALRAGRAHIIDTGERFSESELLRFMGRALMTGDAPDPEAATAAYEQAIAAAAEQNAKLLELRAVTGLAVHQGRTGDQVTALDRVADLCDWFERAGQGSELPDIVRARRLLSVQQTPS